MKIRDFGPFNMCMAALVSALLLMSPAHAGGASQDVEPHQGPVQASAPNPNQEFVDLLAAEFFEHSLRLAQSQRIEAETAKAYLALPPEARRQFRKMRRKIWLSMPPKEREALRGAKRPRFANLDERQKTAFRRIASQELGVSEPLIAAGVADRDI